MAPNIFRNVTMGAAALLGLAVPVSAQPDASISHQPKPENIKDALTRAIQNDEEQSEDVINPGGIWPKISTSDDGSTLYVVGTLHEGSYVKFARTLRASPRVRTVYLSSSGGMVSEGRMIAALIRKRGLSTYVEYLCASACTLAFIAGKERAIAPDARLGFHRSYQVGEDGMILADEDLAIPHFEWPAESAFPQVVGVNGDGVFSRAFERAGVKSDFVEEALKTPSETMWFPDVTALENAGFVTRQAQASEIPPVSGARFSRDTIIANLLARPLWKFYHDTEPKSFASAAGDIWRATNSGIDLDNALREARITILDKVDEKLRLAPDPLLDRFIMLRGEIARHERRDNYPGCRSTPGSSTRVMNDRDRDLIDREDALAVELLTSQEISKALDPKKAERQFEDLADNLIGTGTINIDRLSDQRYQCQSAFQMMEALAALDPKRRVKAFRAMLSME